MGEWTIFRVNIKSRSFPTLGSYSEVDVHMILARLSLRYEFIPVPSCGSVFVYMIPAQNLIPDQSESYRCEFTPVSVPERDSHSGTKTHSDVM